MKRNLKILILVVAVAALLLPFGHALVHAQTTTPPPQEVDNSWFSFLDPVKWLTTALNLIGYFLMRIGGLILTLSALIFDLVLNYTVVTMADKLAPTASLGQGISTAWETLRDIANIVFIFVLLWAAIQTILELNTSKFTSTIRNIIIIALLINFSLFFSKVIIDAANIASIGFYNSILAGSNAQPTDMGEWGKVSGFSNIIMESVQVQSFYGTKLLTTLKQNASADITQFITGILAMVTMLILAVVMLVASVMFIARYILLIFILILSPVAFVGYILPAMRSIWSKWWGALINQSFFAPIFMILMWVAIKIISALAINTQGHEFSTVATVTTDTVGLFMNFALVIGFIIAALIISKQMASKTMGFSAISGGVGAVAIGSAAATGRQTIGRLARARTKNKDLLDRAARGDVGARMQLAAANKLSKSSFDVRAAVDSKLGKAVGAKEVLDSKLLGKAGGKGGFSKSIDDKAKEQAKYAKDTFSQTNAEKAEAARMKPQIEEMKKAEEKQIKENRQREIELATLAQRSASNPEEARLAGERLAKAKQKMNAKFEDDFSEGYKMAKEKYDSYNDAGKNRQNAYADRITQGPRAGVVAAGALLGPLGAGAAYYNRERIGKFVGGLQGNQEAAASIRKQASDKSKEKKLADAYRDLAKEEEDKEKEESGEKGEKPKEEGGGEEKPEGGGEKKTE